jgi:hypothetical protein
MLFWWYYCAKSNLRPFPCSISPVFPVGKPKLRRAQLRLTLCSVCTATDQDAHPRAHIPIQTPLTTPYYNGCGTILAGEDCFQGVSRQVRPKSGPIKSKSQQWPSSGPLMEDGPRSPYHGLLDYCAVSMQLAECVIVVVMALPPLVSLISYLLSPSPHLYLYSFTLPFSTLSFHNAMD